MIDGKNQCGTKDVSKSAKLYMGLFCHGSHDSAVAVADSEGRLLFAAEQERYDRIKHSPAFPEAVIASAFEELSISWDDIGSVAFAWQPFGELPRVGAFLAKNIHHAVPLLFFPKQNTGSRANKLWAILKASERLHALGWKGRLLHFNHHLCHAASSFFSSGFRSAACLTVDGNGEIAATTIHHADGGKFERLHQQDYPDSLGHYYASLTQYLGFKPMNDEYKVMGLAAFGKEDPLALEMREKLGKVLQEGKDGTYQLEQRYFQYRKGRDRMFSGALEELLGPAREPEAALGREHKCIAWAVQNQLEMAMLRLSGKAKALAWKETRLCLSGGVALNCVTNERILREGGWDEVFLSPFPHDSGAAVGAAYLAARRGEGGFSPVKLRSAALGASLGRRDWTAEVGGPNWKYSEPEAAELCRTVAARLAEGKIVAWAMGRSEFGPRALGFRSILADPRKIENKEKLNAVIKRREMFRPFAPVVAAERAGEVFDMGKFPESPFMARTVPVRAEWRERIPAAIHVDGSARVQTLERGLNPLLYRLLEDFGECTGVPVLLNTSLNTAEEPIVNTAEELLRIFQNTSIDLMVADGTLVEKS